MTSTLSPADTGEIRTDAPTEIIRTDVGGTTQNLMPYDAQLPPAFRRPDATVVLYLDDAPVQPIYPLERVAAADETAVVDLLDALGAEPDSYRSVPYAMPTGGPRVRRGRHRRRLAPLWAGMAIGAGVALVAEAVVTFALLAVL